MNREVLTLSTIQRKYIHFQNEKERVKEKTTNIVFGSPSVSIQLSDAEIVNPGQAMRNQYRKLGERQIRSNSISIVILSGGYGCRAEQKPTKEFKQIRLQQSVTNLFENTFNTVIEQVNRNVNSNICIYIICNKMNHGQVLKFVTRYNEQNPMRPPIYICYQHEEDVLDSKGVQSIYTCKDIDNKKIKLKTPAGIGALKKAKIIYDKDRIHTFQEHILEISKPKLVYCVGTSNLSESGIDLELLGFISKEKLDCVYKVDNHLQQRKNLPLVCTVLKEGNEPSLAVLEYQTLAKLTEIQNIRKFPVWMDTFVFSPGQWKKKLLKNPNEIIYQFHDRVLRNSHGDQLQCIVPQMTVSYGFLRDKQKCKGYQSRKQPAFIKTAEDFSRISNYSISISPLKSKKYS